ncbi:hypothetical protein NP493_350g02042 [Ridgeia piscesae]|uniref:Major facilitator superfamily (MFS) profile domain-containing protein n=1 Tax=Ridgeia piscesae TaxID=27915 RepID=A0AAD9L483_RIDPI|nr:hypothetical protein NP493_350g02042 [Ridgeia piscesae]
MTSPVLQTRAAPDGGWGWVICLAAFICNVATDGILFSFGVFYAELLLWFGESKGRTALVGSLLMGTHLLVGPLTSALVNAWGMRIVTMTGALVIFFAFIVSSVAPNIGVLTITYGLIGGVGVSMVYIPSLLVVGFYFERRRALANGITACGSGVGMFVYAPLCHYLQQEYTWRGALFILAAVNIHCLACGALYRPLGARNKRLVSTAIVKADDDEPRCSHEPLPLSAAGTRPAAESALSPPARSRLYMQLFPSWSDTTWTTHVHRPRHLACHRSTTSLRHDPTTRQYDTAVSLRLSTPELSSESGKIKAKTTDTGPLFRKDIFYSGNLFKLYESQQLRHNVSRDHTTCDKVSKDGPEKQTLSSDRKFNSVRRLVQCSVLRNATFLLFMMSSVLWTAHSTVVTILPDYAMLRGYSGQHGALLMSVVGLTNTLGRVLAGWLADRATVTAISINSGALLLGGLTCLAFSATDHYTWLVAEAAVFGLCMAAWTSLRPIVLVELFGIDNLTNAFGWLAMFQGAAFCVGPPLAGVLYEKTMSYKVPFILAGGAFVTSGLLSLFISRQHCAKLMKHADSSDTDSSQVTDTH